MQLYVDMDGVIADFDTHYFNTFGVRACKIADDVDWAKVRSVPDFYKNIPLMPDFNELWEYIKHFYPIVLTGVPSVQVPEAADNKRWYILNRVSPMTKVICCPSKEKYLHAKPGDVLIDDWDRYRHLWEGEGGIWITHTSAAATIERLRELGVTNSKPEIETNA